MLHISLSLSNLIKLSTVTNLDVWASDPFLRWLGNDSLLMKHYLHGHQSHSRTTKMEIWVYNHDNENSY